MSSTHGSGLVHALLLDGDGGARRLDWEEVAAWRAEDGALWLTLDYTEADVVHWLEHAAGLDYVVREALLEPDPRPRAVPHGDALLLVVRGINANHGSQPEDMISIRMWIEPRRILTIRHRPSRSLASIIADLDRGRGPTGIGELTAMLVDRLVDHVAARVDALHDAIADVEDRVLSERRGADVRASLADHRRRAIALRRFLGPEREALSRLASIPMPWLDAAQRAWVAEAADRMMRAIEELDAARDRAAVTHEEVSSHLAELSNQRIYLLSIITTVFMPLGFVCSLLGVRLGGVPLQDASWAFWALVAVFACGVVLQLWMFRRRGWLKRE
jgi:zinc transporter